MSALHDAVNSRPRQILYAAGYAVIVGGLSVALAVFGIAGGEVTAISRALLGLLGIVGAVLLWIRSRFGWRVLLAWALLQIPYLDLNSKGEPLAQAINFPVKIYTNTRRFDESPRYAGWGINVVGLLLTLTFIDWRNRIDSPRGGVDVEPALSDETEQRQIE